VPRAPHLYPHMTRAHWHETKMHMRVPSYSSLSFLTLLSPHSNHKLY